MVIDNHRIKQLEKLRAAYIDIAHGKHEKLRAAYIAMADAFQEEIAELMAEDVGKKVPPNYTGKGDAR